MMTTLAGSSRLGSHARHTLPYTLVAFLFAMTRGGGSRTNPPAARPAPAHPAAMARTAGVAV